MLFGRSLEQHVVTTLKPLIGETNSRAVFSAALERQQLRSATLAPRDLSKAIAGVSESLALFVASASTRAACTEALGRVFGASSVGGGARGAQGPEPDQQYPILSDDDVAVVRYNVRRLCGKLAFADRATVALVTAVSEVTRNIVLYAKTGEVVVRPGVTARPFIEVEARDNGPGIVDVDLVLSGKYVSRTGLGKGLAGTRRLVDEFSIRSRVDAGTTVCIRKYRDS